MRGWDRRLFRHSHEQGAGQFAVCTNEGCVVGFVVLAKKGRRPGIGLFLRQRFVGRTIVVKLCVDGGLSVLRQGSLGSNEVRTIIGKDSRCQFGFRRCHAAGKHCDGQQQAYDQKTFFSCYSLRPPSDRRVHPGIKRPRSEQSSFRPGPPGLGEMEMIAPANPKKGHRPLSSQRPCARSIGDSTSA